MIKRRVFLGGTLSAVAVESCKTQSAEAPVPTAAIQPLEPLVWPIVTKLPDGIRAFAGHVKPYQTLSVRSEDRRAWLSSPKEIT
jgi:hypothetical protein